MHIQLRYLMAYAQGQYAPIGVVRQLRPLERVRGQGTAVGSECRPLLVRLKPG
jgi:hypothetical protein